MFRSPDSYGYLVATYNPSKVWTLNLSGVYTGSMLTQHMAGSGTPVSQRESDLPFYLASGTAPSGRARVILPS